MKSKRGSVVPTPPPAPPSAAPTRLDALSADNGLIAHFIRPAPLPLMPWELPLEARQRRSKDPRTVKHIADIDRWNGTPLEAVWARIRQFAEARRDWVMTRYDVIDWLRSEGITSELVLDRLADVFEAKEAGTAQANTDSIAHGVAALTRNSPAALVGFGGSPIGGPGGGPSGPMLSGLGLLHTPAAPSAGGRGTASSRPNTTHEGGGAGGGTPAPKRSNAGGRSGGGSGQGADAAAKLLTFREKELLARHNAQRFNAIILCKYLELGLTSYPYDDLFIQHCFDQFDRPLGSVRLSKAMILRSEVKPLPVKGKGRGKGASPRGGDGNNSVARSGSVASVNGGGGGSRLSTPQAAIGNSPNASGGGGEKANSKKGPFKMGSGATFAMIEPLRRMIQRGEFDVVSSEGGGEGGGGEREGGSNGGTEANKTVDTSAAAGVRLPPINGSDTAKRPSAASPSSTPALTVGFASLDLAAMNPRTAHFTAPLRRAPVATGHASDYAHAVLVAMRKNYDTDLQPTPPQQTQPHSSAAGNNGVNNTTTVQCLNTSDDDSYDGGHQSHATPSDVISSALALYASQQNGGRTPHVVPLPAPPSYGRFANPSAPSATSAIAGGKLDEKVGAPTSASSPQTTPANANARPLSPDDITYEMFKFAFLDGANAQWVAAFTLPLLECCLKYFAPPHGELPLVSLRWLRDVGAVPVPEVQYDADAALLKEAEELGYDPWLEGAKKKKKPKGGKGDEKRTRR